MKATPTATPPRPSYLTVVFRCQVAEQLANGASELIIAQVMEDDVIEWVELLHAVHEIQREDHPLEEQVLEPKGQSSHGTQTTKEGHDGYCRPRNQTS